MQDSIWQLQKAVYDKLSGDATLGNLVTGVFDYVPQGTDFPYVAIGEMQSNDYSTKTTTGAQINFSIESLVRERGTKSLVDIMARVQELLHDTSLTLTGHTLTNLRYVSSDVTQVDDGLTHAGISRFRAITNAD